VLKNLAFTVSLFFLVPAVWSEQHPQPQDINTTETAESSLLESLMSEVDDFQSYWSHRMRLFSSNVDRRLSTVFTDEELQSRDESTFFLTRWFNSYFIDQTYFDPTNESYIRLIGTYGIGSKSDDISYTDIRARVMIPRSKDRLQLFIGDETKGGDELSAVASDQDHSGIGLRYLKDFLSDRMRTSLSVGISGIDNPYVRARMSYPLYSGRWMFQPIQTFRYSADDKFEEWTNFIIANQLGDNAVAQLLLQRSTREDERGMAYLAELSYQQVNHHDVGIKPYAALFGRTHSNGIVYGNGVLAEEGVYSYALGVIWKRPVLRDYIFYQIHPGVEFHEQFDYEADYVLRFSLEFFIGEVRR
jgi:hypothetical protein